jgi:hypothetical protein
MNPDMVLLLGAGAVVGAVVMAVALIRFGHVLRRPPVETPTREYDALAEEDVVVAAFNDARDQLLPLYIADAPGIPLDTDEQRVIRDIEAGLGDPEFRALFEGPNRS